LEVISKSGNFATTGLPGATNYAGWDGYIASGGGTVDFLAGKSGE
jgi:hypothetical protein